jgi:ABC-type transport system substrate-binding protein
MASGEFVVIPSGQPIAEFALARNSIVLRSADGTMIGTGPFRISKFEPGRRASLVAHEDHWQGRPFLDTIEIEMGRTPKDQSIDLDLGKADLVEVLPGEVRRVSQRARIWSSAPVELMALVFEPNRPASLGEALALSIDRAAIHNVLLQKQGEIAGGLLPQWLSGYAFLFPTTPDLPRARQLASAVPNRQLSLTYEASDPLARSIAERIAVNAREAGIMLQVSSQLPKPDLRLVRQLDKAPALSIFGALQNPEQSYAAERAQLASFQIIPLFHLPQIYALSPRVKNWAATRWGDWRLAGVSLDPEKP